VIEFREESSSEELENVSIESEPIKTHPIFGIFVIGVIFLLFLIVKRSIF